MIKVTFNICRMGEPPGKTNTYFSNQDPVIILAHNSLTNKDIYPHIYLLEVTLADTTTVYVKQIEYQNNASVKPLQFNKIRSIDGAIMLSSSEVFEAKLLYNALPDKTTEGIEFIKNT